MNRLSAAIDSNCMICDHYVLCVRVADVGWVCLDCISTCPYPQEGPEAAFQRLQEAPEEEV